MDVSAAPTAPILRYSDRRLYGAALTEPFRNVYAHWIRPLSFPTHPETNKFFEFGRRSVNALAGVIFFLVFLPFAFIGKCAQIIHFHTLSKEERDQPVAVTYQGMSLPEFHNASQIQRCCFGPFTADEAASTLRAGKPLQHEVDPRREREWTVDATVAQDVSFRERAFISLTWHEVSSNFRNQWNRPDRPGSECFEAVHELFARNGIRVLETSDMITAFDPLALVNVRVEVARAS